MVRNALFYDSHIENQTGTFKRTSLPSIMTHKKYITNYSAHYLIINVLIYFFLKIILIRRGIN